MSLKENSQERSWGDSPGAGFVRSLERAAPSMAPPWLLVVVSAARTHGTITPLTIPTSSRWRHMVRSNAPSAHTNLWRRKQMLQTWSQSTNRKALIWTQNSRGGINRIYLRSAVSTVTCTSGTAGHNSGRHNEHVLHIPQAEVTIRRYFKKNAYLFLIGCLLFGGNIPGAKWVPLPLPLGISSGMRGGTALVPPQLPTTTPAICNWPPWPSMGFWPEMKHKDQTMEGRAHSDCMQRVKLTHESTPAPSTPSSRETWVVGGLALHTSRNEVVSCIGFIGVPRPCRQPHQGGLGKVVAWDSLANSLSQPLHSHHLIRLKRTGDWAWITMHHIAEEATGFVCTVKKWKESSFGCLHVHHTDPEGGCCYWLWAA